MQGHPVHIADLALLAAYPAAAAPFPGPAPALAAALPRDADRAAEPLAVGAAPAEEQVDAVGPRDAAACAAAL
ncbi:hypothetical protein CGMCC3_g14619 [Colletotrichum fructicola]|nr:uncharacterized protein CGMCC3_g14619 [Colletotrichum fructicola]KAE9569301.1 hypothetical protein CGMCC3_g14619 [Colletotrichum fructicola]